MSDSDAGAKKNYDALAVIDLEAAKVVSLVRLSYSGATRPIDASPWGPMPVLD